MRLSRRFEPFDSDDYVFALKIDGFRALAYIENGHCDLVSRNGNTFRNFKDFAPWIGDNLARPLSCGALLYRCVTSTHE